MYVCMYVYKPTQPTIPPIALTNARNVILLTLYGGQFTLSTQLIILNYPVYSADCRSICWAQWWPA